MEPKCPTCKSENTYFDGSLEICTECFYEWNPNEESETNTIDENIVKDSNGALLTDGDSVTIIKDLKVKGSQSGIKSGTKVKNIKLIESNDGHNISCKIEGIGAMYLKSEFVKKA